MRLKKVPKALQFLLINNRKIKNNYKDQHKIISLIVLNSEIALFYTLRLICQDVE